MQSLFCKSPVAPPDRTKTTSIDVSLLLTNKNRTMRILLLLSLFALTTALSAQLVGETENGLASYYSNEYQGAETAYGEIYDRNELVAAHRMYPLGSVVKVRNVENGKTVSVRVIDKGPFIRGRIIELSERAAANIGLLGKETVPVELTLISTPDQPATATREPEPEVRIPDPEVVVEVITREPDPIPAERTVVVQAPSPAPAAPPKNQAAEKSSSQAVTPPPTVNDATATVKAKKVSTGELVRTSAFAPGVYKIALEKPASGAYGVQVGSFVDLEGAMDKVTQMQSKWFDNVLLERIGTGPGSIYKVILGPFETQKSAARYASDLKKRYKVDGFTVRISAK